jgi:hypothetical protein
VPIRTSPNLLLLGAAGSAAAIAGAIACRDWLRYPYPDMQTLDFQRGWLHRWSVSLVSIRVGYRDAPIYCVLVRNGGDWFPGRSIQRIGTNRTRGWHGLAFTDRFEAVKRMHVLVQEFRTYHSRPCDSGNLQPGGPGCLGVIQGSQFTSWWLPPDPCTLYEMELSGQVAALKPPARRLRAA